MSNNSIRKTILVSFLLCFVCSIMVSVSVVLLEKKQEENKAMDIKRNLLMATGLINEKAKPVEVNESYKKIEEKMVDLSKGEFTSEIDPQNFELKKSRKNPKESLPIDSSMDIAHIKIRSKYSKIYFVKENGIVSQIVLPVYGKGLWSTMFGFLSLSPDLVTVKGFQFYEHGETPGLGGEVDNPNWRSLWKGKKVFDGDFNPQVDIIKGKVSENPNQDHQVDGLSGATLTSNGVENLIRYWLGKDGYQPFLKKLKQRGDLR